MTNDESMSERPDRSDQEQGFGLDSFRRAPQDQGLTLERLSESFARLLGEGDDPYQPAAPSRRTGTEPASAASPSDPAYLPAGDEGFPPDASNTCPITPKSILEAVLFVGHPNNEPLTSHQMATLMRGVRPSEVDQLVRELDRQYAEEGCPYHVESIGTGYRLALRRQYDSWRSRFYGKIRQARLSQAAIDVLAIVAYRQPVQRDEIDKLRGKPSGAILSQLVRRKLLRIDGRDGPQRMPLYRTTDRFLALFELGSLDELPRGQEPDALGPK